MHEKMLGVVEKIVMIGALVLAVLLVFMTSLLENTVEKSRPDADYIKVENYTFETQNRDSEPIGIVNTMCFSLDEIDEDDALVFFLNHHSIRVFLDDEKVYEVVSEDSFLRTTGGVWVNIPLKMEDEGKIVKIEMSPFYKSYSKKIPEIYLGSPFAVYKQELLDSLPELALSLCVMLSGVFILCLGVYHSFKRQTVMRLYSIGVMGVSAGLWRFTYSSFLRTLVPDHDQLIYTLSIISLMIVSVSLINSLELAENKKGKKIIGWVSVVYCASFFVQLILQIFGVFDLKEMLEFTHITIITSALIVFVNGGYSFAKAVKAKSKGLKVDYSWLLGVGVIVDLAIYYFAKNSSEMLFTLVAILCFSLLEGAILLISYSKQKNTISQMQTQLVLSRTTTMMSQIRSHFVFNILNAISGMCKYDPEKADDTIVRFSRYLRNNIDIMENDKNIPFSTDLRQLEDYVALEQIRFGDKIEFYEEIEVDNFLIPPLILQPVVENAIKHGVSKKLDNGKIILKTRDRGDYVEIIVEDDGVGFDMSRLDNEKSVGIRNIRFRLEQLVDGRLEISSQEGKGTTVTIIIPRKGQD